MLVSSNNELVMHNNSNNKLVRKMAKMTVSLEIADLLLGLVHGSSNSSKTCTLG